MKHMIVIIGDRHVIIISKKMLEKKPATKTKVIIMSATADIVTFQKYFKGIKSPPVLK